MSFPHPKKHKKELFQPKSAYHISPHPSDRDRHRDASHSACARARCMRWGPRAARRISRRRRRRRRKSPAPPTCPKCRRLRAFRGLEDVMMWAEVVLGGLSRCTFLCLNRSGDSSEGGRFFQRVGGWLRDFVCFLDLLSCCTDCSNSLGG